MDKPKIILGKLGSGKTILARRMLKDKTYQFVHGWDPEFNSKILAINPDTEFILIEDVTSLDQVTGLLQRGFHHFNRFYSTGKVVYKIPVVITSSRLKKQDFDGFEVDIYSCGYDANSANFYANGDVQDPFDVQKEVSIDMRQDPEKVALFWDGQHVVINANLVGIIVSSYWCISSRIYRVIVDADDCASRVRHNSIDQSKDLLQLKQDIEELLWHSKSSVIMEIDENALNYLPEFVMEKLGMEDHEFDEKLEKERENTQNR